jgi:hypothetical protein
MKRLKLAAAVGIVVAAGALTQVASSAAIADSGRSGAAAAAAAMSARAASFRESFGLRSDVALIQRSVTDAAAFPNRRFGVPLTTAEGAEMQRRIRVQQAATPAAEWAAGQRGFGGWYIDQLDGGTPVILVAGDPSAFGKAFAQHLTSSVSYRVAAVANSQQSLQTLEDRIWADRGDLAKIGIDVEGVSLDIPMNAVRVEVAGLTRPSAATLKSRYGAVEAVENVPAETDSCSRTDCPPAKGGLKITDVQHPAFQCTLGFNAKLVSNGSPLILTAGHCLTEGVQLSNDWSHAGTTLGHGLVSLWGPTYDAGLITQGSISGDDNLVFWSSASDIPHVVAIASLSGMPVGTPACRSAFVSGYYCGKVTAIEATKDVDGRTVSHMWVENFDAIPGDSGAPVGLETASGRLLAYGTHSDSTSANPPGGSGWFEPIYYSANGLNNAGFHYILCTLTTC